MAAPQPAGILATASSACCCIICVVHCACQGCLLYRYHNLNETCQARKLHHSCMSETLRMTRDEKKNYFLTKLQSFQVKITPKKSYKFVFVIGSDKNVHVVCRSGFRQAYNMTSWYLDDLITRMKKGQKYSVTELNPRSKISSSDVSDKRISLFAEAFGINLSHDSLGSLRLSNSIPSMLCASWMQYYFSLVGDNAPNTDGEIHLEPIPKREIFKEYLFDMQNFSGRENDALSLDVFRALWKDVYPHVKIRKYKSSCGHCNLCTILSEKRRLFKDRRGREEVTNLFALHRLSTMGERRTYYDRRLQATLNPSMFLSSISDGMQQNHCLLPWYGNGKSPGNTHVKQHLQGVFMHGDTMTIYRTYANVGGGANLAIHTWLCSLEDYARRHKWRLPKVLYHQIDGGPENANKEFLALCCLLVSSGLVDKIVLTRLPVGHTHEDIDALFALIWKKLRDEHIYTPGEFARLICEALKRKVKVNVVDVFAVPDYVSLFKDCIDARLSRFSKEEWAQLQFIFEADADSSMGVKTTYRAYAQDSFIEIVEDDAVEQQSACGLIPQECIVKNRPLPGEAPVVVLTKMPSGDIKPAPFIAGSRDIIDEVSVKMRSQFAKGRPEVTKEWMKWSTEQFPASDNVQDYVTTHCGTQPVKSVGTEFVLNADESDSCGVYIPFKEQLFGKLGLSEFDVIPRQRNSRSGGNMRVVESTTCVQHAGHKNTTASKVPSRLVVQEADGTTPVEGRGVLNSVYAGREERRRIAQEVRRKRNSDKQASSSVMTTDGNKSTNNNAESVSSKESNITEQEKEVVVEKEKEVVVENTNDVVSKKTKRARRGKKSDPSTQLKSNITLVDTTNTQKRKSTKSTNNNAESVASKESNITEQEKEVVVENTNDVVRKKSDPSIQLKSNITLVDTTTTKKRKSTKGSISIIEVKKTTWVDTGKCCPSNILSCKRKRTEKKY